MQYYAPLRKLIPRFKCDHACLLQSVRDGEVVRVVKGKKGSRGTKRGGEGEEQLPLFPRMLARIPFLSKKSGATERSSGVLEDEEEVSARP